MINATLNILSGFALNYSRRVQAKQGLPDLRSWGLDRKDSQLYINGVSASELVARFGSPLLVLNEAQLNKDIDVLQQAFASAPAGSKIVYSYKTNGIPGILRHIHTRGIGAEVISPYELWLAERMSVPGENIVYNGVSKTEESLLHAINLQVMSINVDSMEELKMLQRLSCNTNKKIAIGLRLGLDDKSQFGLDVTGGEAAAACRYLADNKQCFDLVSIHSHTVANAQNSYQHIQYLQRALDVFRLLKMEHNIEAPYFNIGGGFGVPTSMIMPRHQYALYRLFGVQPPRPDGKNYQPLADYISNIVKLVVDFCHTHSLKMPKLIIEPGRVIVSRAEILLTRVNCIKTKSNCLHYAMTDAGKHSIAYPCDYEYHDIVVANKLDQSPEQFYQIVGRICSRADMMAKNKLLPRLANNDLLAIMDAGAYFSSYSSNFAFQRPAIVEVAGGKCELIRQEESFEHLVAMDTLFTRETP